MKEGYLWLNRKFIWPDPSGSWYFFAVKKIKKLIKNRNYCCLISSSAPFTPLLLGYYVKKAKKNIPWIAEYGDPFSFNPQKSQNIFNFLDRAVEKKIINKTSKIVVPCYGAKKGFLSHFPSLEKNNIRVIPQAAKKIIDDPTGVNWKFYQKEKMYKC